MVRLNDPLLRDVMTRIRALGLPAPAFYRYRQGLAAIDAELTAARAAKLAEAEAKLSARPGKRGTTT